MRNILFAALLLARVATGEEIPPVGELVDIGGGRLHLVCMGSGSPTVIFESGAAEGFYTWWNLQQELRGAMRTCSYDRAGFGWSDPPHGERSIDGYNDDLHALLRKAGEKPPFLLVGHSLGGSLVQRFYWRHPEGVAAIIALDPPNSEAGMASFPAYRAAATAHRARRTKEMEEWRAKDTWPAQSFPDQLPEELRKKLIAKSPSRNWWEARFGEGALPDGLVSLSEEQRRIAVPLLVVTATKSARPRDWSEKTFAAFGEHQRRGHEEIVSRSPRGRRIEAPTSHSPQLDAPAFVAAQIRAMASSLAK